MLKAVQQYMYFEMQLEKWRAPDEENLFCPGQLIWPATGTCWCYHGLEDTQAFVVRLTKTLKGIGVDPSLMATMEESRIRARLLMRYDEQASCLTIDREPVQGCTCYTVDDLRNDVALAICQTYGGETIPERP